MSLSPVALITGITGQDGSYLAELLLEKGYTVYGIKRRQSTIQSKNIEHIKERLHLFYGDMTDIASLISALGDIKTRHAEIFAKHPLEIYNLAAQSHVQVSFQVPVYTAHTDAIGVLHLLEAVRALDLTAHARIYQASTSELYGLAQTIPQNEMTPFHPRSPYACAKLYGFWISKNYRESYGMYTSNGILFNHESPRRGENFVTRKITIGVAKFLQSGKVIELGNLNALRDWGHARDYVEGMWRILQQETPDDYVLATGKQYSVRQFVEAAFGATAHHIIWHGSGPDEYGVVSETGAVAVRVNPSYYRPAEVDSLLGDPTKAISTLGWKHTHSFEELVKEMVVADIAAFGK